MPERSKRLAVGQVWVVHNPDYPARYWHFQIVAETVWEGATYYVALKCDVHPDSLQAVVFNSAGQTVDKGPFAYNFVCSRRSRRTRAHGAGLPKG